MKSNRILQIVIVVLIIIFAIAGGMIYSQNSNEQNKQKQLTNTLNADKLTYNSGLAQKATLDKSAVDLASQLAAAKALLAKAHFRSASESVEYDRIIYALADTAKVRITNLTASAPSAVTEQNTIYQLTTFTFTAEGYSPDLIFTKADDDAAYLTLIDSNLLAFLHSISASPDFDTTIIQSVNVSNPTPMTDADVQNEIDGINAKIAVENKDAITTLTTQIQTNNAGTLTPDQINVLVKAAVDKLIADALKAKSADDIKKLVDQAGIARPSEVITINIWTSKGA